MEERKLLRSQKKASVAGRRIIIVLATLLLISMLAAGCRYTAAPADLLEKPSIGDEKERLTSAILKALPRYSKLMLPHSDDYREAIRLLDLDGDGEKEALVTYYNEYSAPEVVVLKQSENGWRQWVMIEQPMARDIAWIKLQDLDSSGWLELLVGWVGSIESPNVLEVYSFQSKAERNDRGRLKLKPVQSIPYQLATTGDLDGDGYPEIAVISASARSGESEPASYFLTVHSWTPGNITIKDTFQLPEGVHSFERMLLGQVAEGIQGLVLEGGTGAHSMLTYMYAWEAGSLQMAYPSRIVGLDDGGFSDRPTKSGDMNGDGIIELNRTREAPGNDDVPYSDMLWINDWIQWDGIEQSFTKVAEQYIDNTYGVELDIPAEWRNRYSMAKPPKTSYGIATFYFYKENEVKAELATLYVVPNRQWSGVESVWREENRPYKVLASNSGNMFIVSFARNAPDGLDDAQRDEFNAMLKAQDQFSKQLVIKND
ncbi:FG-GAP repeat domain-containing protein [Paenibacillus sp. CAU 1782]